MKETKVAIVGFGGIARAHMSAYDLLEAEGFPIRRVALCDVNPEQFTKVQKINIDTGDAQDIGALGQYTDFDEMIANEDIDMVLICLPTYLHKEYTIRALRAGKDVLCEKPMALNSADCAEMLAVAKECGKHLMIGQCMRFESPYVVLKDELDSGKHGRVLMMRMDRMSALPRWGFEDWFTDFSRSGGEMQDMSIHDYDFARYLLGEPTKVSAVTVDYEMPEQCSRGTLYYENGTIVTVDGSWAEAPGFFTCGYHVICEKASIIWDGTSDVHVHPKTGEAYDIAYPKINEYAEEARFFITCCNTGEKNEKNPPESAMRTIELIERLRESAQQGGAVLDFNQ